MMISNDIIKFMAKERTALLVRCSVEEAEKIRAVAEAERRTISGFVLSIVMRYINLQEKLQQQRTPRPWS
jgi:uncharacterized protein (DUF1778 family)